MYSCREAEKMVMPYINHQLDETQLEQFLKHVRSCPACREELEIYYTVSVGLKQLDEGTGVYDIPGLLEESMENAWRALEKGDLLCGEYAECSFCPGHFTDAASNLDPTVKHCFGWQCTVTEIQIVQLKFCENISALALC